MLDPNGQFVLSELPDIFLYPDTDLQHDFYAIPAHPRVAIDEKGNHQINLVVYGKIIQDEFKEEGGILTVCFTLSLTLEERKLVLNCLNQYLEKHLQKNKANKSTEVKLREPDWLQSKAFFRLGLDNIHTGVPSNLSGNQCVFNIQLNAEQVSDIQEKWINGLNGLSICYQTTVNTTASSRSDIRMKSSSHCINNGNGAASINTASYMQNNSSNMNLELELDGFLEIENDVVISNYKQVIL